jgi:cytochrome b subunit of formate dehydrogenase
VRSWNADLRDGADPRHDRVGQTCALRRLLSRPGWFVLLPTLALLALLAGTGCGEAPVAPLPGPASSVVPPPASAGRIAPAVNATSLAKSVHAGLDCSDCHAPRTGEPPSVRARQAGDQTRCLPCHRDAVAAYDRSVHARALGRGQTKAARCVHCHGSHDTLKSTDPRSRVHKRRLPMTCSQCHRLPASQRQGEASVGSSTHQYAESIHQRALLVEGLLAAPSCIDCHGKNHGIAPAANARSTVHRSRIPATCGKCHQGLEEKYRRSIHGRLLAEGNSDVPVCTDCHPAHRITAAIQRRKLDDEKLCGRCHAAQMERYLQTYHGRALNLGHGEVAACHDCHGHHDILPATDPASTLSAANRQATCQSCHPKSTASFAQFQAHGDHTDRQNYPVLFWTFVIMTGLIVSTFGVWGVHTLFWAVRMWLDYRRDPERFRQRKANTRKEIEGKLFVRFSPIDRFCHTLVITSFLVLVGTGMPLKFHQTGWAHAIFDLLGGAEVAATLHRIGACISGTYLAIHIIRLLVALVRSRGEFRGEDGQLSPRRFLGVLFGPDSPLPNWQDARDLVAHSKWFVGRGPRPNFDRFTYWEKFDYLAEFWGSAFIGVSGLVMWFPEQVSRIAPGWIVNVAQVIHSQEALLAAGFILTFHFFNAHFRSEKFPLDSVMFSGRVTEEEMLHERRRQYDRLAKRGTLEQLRLKDEWASAKWLYNTLGLLMVYLGIALAVAIFWTLGQRIWGG